MCGVLCCELPRCDLALLEEGEKNFCYAVECFSRSSCELGPSQIATVMITMSRKDRSIWNTVGT